MTDKEIRALREGSKPHTLYHVQCYPCTITLLADEALRRGQIIEQLKDDLKIETLYNGCERIAQLEAALRRFGYHSAGCATHADGTWIHSDAGSCGCGLRAALEEQP